MTISMHFLVKIIEIILLFINFKKSSFPVLQSSVKRAVLKSWCDSRMVIELNPAHVSLQLVRWAISSRSQAPLPAQCARPTAEPARKDRLHVNAAAAFIGQPGMPTPLPAQVSFVSLFVLRLVLWEAFKGPRWSVIIDSDSVNGDV